MSELEEFRKELDELRDRVILLEDRSRLEMSDSTRILNIARAADRTASESRSEVVDGFAKIDADLARITNLLKVALNAPAET